MYSRFLMSYKDIQITEKWKNSGLFSIRTVKDLNHWKTLWGEIRIWIYISQKQIYSYENFVWIMDYWMVKLYKKYIENSQNRQQISLFIKPHFCYNTMTKGYINITGRGMIYVIYRKSHKFFQRIPGNGKTDTCKWR